MNIPRYLIDEIRTGRVVLVLGAGASKGAINNQGKEAPNGQELAKLLSNKFLGVCGCG
ncbi:MAG: hypothetical protein ABSC17_07375 [Thermacetogeniaceae bacterium]